MANLPRIRSAKEAADELRKLDPGTAPDRIISAT